MELVNRELADTRKLKLELSAYRRRVQSEESSVSRENLELRTQVSTLETRLHTVLQDMRRQTQEHDDTMQRLQAQLENANTKIGKLDGALVEMHSEVSRIHMATASAASASSSSLSGRHGPPGSPLRASTTDRAGQVLRDLRALQTTYTRVEEENRELQQEVRQLRQHLQRSHSVLQDAHAVRSEVREHLKTPLKHARQLNDLMRAERGLASELNYRTHATPELDRFMRASRRDVGASNAGSSSSASADKPPEDVLVFLREELTSYQKIFEELSSTTSLQARIIDQLMADKRDRLVKETEE